MDLASLSFRNSQVAGLCHARRSPSYFSRAFSECSAGIHELRVAADESLAYAQASQLNAKDVGQTEMFSKLAALFQGRPREPMRETVDPVLGRCIPDREEGWWRAHVEVGGHKLGFILGGDSEPDSRVLAHAREIVADFAFFERRVRDFLQKEAAAAGDPTGADEITHLQLEDVCLFWPDRPGDGMLYFAGPENGPVWRCDYVRGVFQSLGCDT